jgi:exodeoxyribonuclease VII large subunit
MSALESVVTKTQELINFSADTLSQARRELSSGVERNFALQSVKLAEKVAMLEQSCLRQIGQYNFFIRETKAVLPRIIANSLDQQIFALQQRRAVINALDPKKQMTRGWSLVRDKNGAVIKSVTGLKQGDPLSVFMRDGNIEVEVK